MANKSGVEFDQFDATEVLKRPPYIADLKPSGRYVAKDMLEARGAPLSMKTLLDRDVLLRGNLAPDGALIKVAGMAGLRFSAPSTVTHMGGVAEKVCYADI